MYIIAHSNFNLWLDRYGKWTSIKERAKMYDTREEAFNDSIKIFHGLNPSIVIETI